MELRPLLAELVERARAAGQLRADCEPEDLPILTRMLSALNRRGTRARPDLWRRCLAIVLQGLRAKPAPPEPLPAPPLAPRQMDKVLMRAWKPRRA
jgi:hypothetical protein